MAAFRFSLEKVLELRRQSELERARGLAVARSEADAARAAKSDLDAVREAGIAQLAHAHGAGGSVGHIRNLQYIVSKVEEQVGRAEAICQEADRKVSANLSAFREAFRRRKALDHLKERKLHQWRCEETRTERKELDEVALTRHTRLEAERRAGSGK